MGTGKAGPVADTIRQRIRDGAAAVVTANGYTYFVYEPITLEDDSVSFALWPDGYVISLDYTEIAEVVPTSPS